MGNLLFIEDDQNIRTSTRLFLEKRQLTMDEAETGQQGLDMFSEDKHELVLLDLMLPDIYGLDVCRELRARSTVPIIIVTAKDDTHEVVEGLSSGADDYLTKPFEPQVLAARIDAMLRRIQFHDTPGAPTVHDNLRVVPAEGRIFRDEREIHLTRGESLLFMELYRNPGQAVSRDRLSEVLWEEKPQSNNRLVDIQISRLRSKIELDVSSPQHIVTVRRVGYKFEP